MIPEWKPVPHLKKLLHLSVVEFRVFGPEDAKRARWLLMLEASMGRVLAASERRIPYRVSLGTNIRGRKRFRTGIGVTFRVVAPYSQGDLFKIRLATELKCSASDPYRYLREYDLERPPKVKPLTLDELDDLEDKYSPNIGHR